MKLFRLIALFLLFAAPAAYGQNEVQIPNIFTPDGDGKNDRFHIESNGYSKMTCTIYNRHGAIVYRFHGVDGSWDGYTHAGVKVTPGVYFVFLELTTEGSLEGETRQGTLEVIYR